MSVLQRVLDELREVGGASPDEIAARTGLAPDEVDAAVGYWLAEGRLRLRVLQGCQAVACDDCRLRSTCAQQSKP